jgi:hypothetical protein
MKFVFHVFSYDQIAVIFAVINFGHVFALVAAVFDLVDAQEVLDDFTASHAGGDVSSDYVATSAWLAHFAAFLHLLLEERNVGIQTPHIFEYLRQYFVGFKESVPMTVRRRIQGLSDD